MFFTDKKSQNMKKAKKNPSVTRRRRRRRWQKFVPRLQPRPQDLESWNFGFRILLGQLDVLHTQNFEVQVPKGTPLVKVFLRFCQGTVFMTWKWFHRVQQVRFSQEKCCQIYPRMEFLEQNL
jgi:hypothetical protein